MAFIPLKAKHWYSTWWGAAILAALVLIAASIIAFGLLIFRYWYAVRSGQGEQLKQSFATQQQTAEDPAATAARKILETTDDPYLGNANGSIVIVEFVDLKCPYCKKEDDVVWQIIKKYGYDVKIIIRDFPVESNHEGATQAAAIGSCANEQGGYFAVAKSFFDNQDSDAYLSLFTDTQVNNLFDYFDEEYGLDKSKMLECMKSNRGTQEVRADYADLLKVVKSTSIGTPIFFVNGVLFADSNGTNKGYIPLETWEELFQKIGLSK